MDKFIKNKSGLELVTSISSGHKNLNILRKELFRLKKNIFIVFKGLSFGEKIKN